MMQKLTLTWKGEKATLSEDQAFFAADAIEQVVTFGELVSMRQSGANIRFTQIAKAYAALLTEAGIPAKARDVHAEFMKAVRTADKSEKLAMALEAIDWLLIVLMDGAPEAEADAEGDTSGNETAPAS